MIRARLEIEPFGEPRPRARAVPQTSAGKCRCGFWKKWMATLYTAKTSRQWRNRAVATMRMLHRPTNPLDGPLFLGVVAVKELAKSKHRVRAPVPRMWDEAKPDFDNVLKALADAMVDAGWISDDALVVKTATKHVVGAQGEPAALHVTCYRLEDLP